jgi:hypothetical protein
MQTAERVWFSTLALGLALAAGCSASGGPTPGAPSNGALAGGAAAADAFARLPNGPAVRFNAPYTPPPGTIYLGAYVANNKDETPPEQISDTAAFETTIGRKLAMNLHYHLWTDTLVGVGEQDDISNGRIPFVSWSCVEADQTGVNDTDIAAGMYDAAIAKRAAAVAAVAPNTIFLRYKWEMNLVYNQGCAGPNDKPDKYGKVHYSPTDYIAAWEHIRSVFAANGATNVVWVWNPSGNGDPPDLYYPGDSQVDWVDFDWYDTFDLYFEPIYTYSYNHTKDRETWTYPYFSKHHANKPLMIGETGAEPVWQANYFRGESPTYARAVTALQKSFPNIAAYVYWNSSGGRGDFRIVPPGLGLFKKFANDPYLSGTHPDP